MKSPSIIALLLFAIGQPVWANDDAKSSSNSSSHSSAPASGSAKSAPATSKGPQTATGRPVNPASNPNLRPVNPTLNAPSSRRVPPTVNRNRTIVPTSLPGARNAPNRTAVVTPNQRPNTTANNNGARRTRIPARSGNELSFSQARTQCSRQHHDRDWWRHHHSRICFYGGGYWFWNAGWWFPAWGYSPYYSSYAYDGPIYGYGQLSPGDVTAQVQQALAELGYYYGAIDGVLGPDTRDAILRFQADNGLATTAAIDEPTLDTLGLT
jgi:Putative peptidoglycan binding domain